MSQMTISATFQGNFSPLSPCTRCCIHSCIPAAVFSVVPLRKCSRRSIESRLSRSGWNICKSNNTESVPESSGDKEVHGDGEICNSVDSTIKNNVQIEAQEKAVVQELLKDGKIHHSTVDSPVQDNIQIEAQEKAIDQDKDQFVGQVNLNTDNMVDTNNPEGRVQESIQLVSNSEVTSGSPLPGINPQQLDDSTRIPKETIEILRNQVFGFDTFFVTSQEPYEGGVLFKGNLRGKATESYEKIKRKLEERFDGLYILFLLVDPDNDKPVAVVVPRKTLESETTATTAVPEWFAAGAFGLVTIFTLLLRNVPALQSNLLSTFDNLGLLSSGLPGAAVTALTLGVHELGHIFVASRTGIKLGVPYFVPSWQIGSFGAITRITNIVSKREDLLKVAAAGPIAGFSAGLLLLLLGFVLPPADGIGLVVDSSVFHESLLAGGIAKLILGDVLKEGTPLSVNPLVLWAWAGLLINAINCIPAGELDGGRISFAIWGRKASSRITGICIALLGLASLFSDVAFYWAALIFFLQRRPVSPLSEEITNPDDRYVALGIFVLLLGLLICLPYPFPFTNVSVPDFSGPEL